MRRSRKNLVMTVVVTLAMATSMFTGAPEPADAAHTLPPFSQGVYRIPYADGTNVTVDFDYHTHNGTLNKLDLDGGDGSTIVAAAGGWVRYVVENHGDDGGNGDGMAWDGSPHVNDPDDGMPFQDSDEEGCMDDVDMSDNAIPDSQVTGRCSWYNNYVWIEHPNGEWTKYTHFQTQTVIPNEGDWVDAGDPLGLQGNVGFSGSSHLHHELMVPDDPTDPINSFGFADSKGDLFVINVCDIAGNIYVAGDSHPANPCTNQTPTADAGGPYTVDEGSQVQFDAGASSDPDGTPLDYLWVPQDRLDDATLQQPTFNAVDDEVVAFTLNVFDQTEAWTDVDATSVTVLNVAPTVTASGFDIAEGGVTSVSATITDPGSEDTHVATIFWGDAGPVSNVTSAQLAAGVDHEYGDNGTYDVTVVVIDDDGGVGFDVVSINVGNIDPVLTLDTSGEIAFPGGDFQVVAAGDPFAATADGGDAGSDDLTFDWSLGAANIHYNDGVGPDPAMSPFGTFPFFANDGDAGVFASPGVEQLLVTLTDDDGGSDAGDSAIIVTGTASASQGNGWWKHQFGGQGSPQLPNDLLDGYRAIVVAVSSVFSEVAAADDLDDVHAVLSPTGDKRAKARAALMIAWLEFASGAVALDASVPLADGSTVAYLDLMTAAEQIILDPTATDATLVAIRQDLDKVRHAA